MSQEILEEIENEKNDIAIDMKTNLNLVNKKDKINKNGFYILGISIWRLLAYFIIYSIAGYIVETIFGIVTKGVWESRQSFLYGPFCGIYGLGAVIMIVLLQYFTKNYNTLFIGGFIIGSIIEYLVSLFGEMALHVKWWDYSNMPLNIDGRVCVYFSIFWGFLGIYLMASLNPKIDRLIDWIKHKVKSITKLKILTLIVTILLFIDFSITGIAINFFLIRTIKENDIITPYKTEIDNIYNDIYSNEKLSKFIYKFWGDKKMLKTFPNLKITDSSGNIVYIDSLLPEIQPYYLKIYNK